MARNHAARLQSAAVTAFLIPLGLSITAYRVTAQTITVDAAPSHVANTFSPLRALGTTVDRIPTNTTEIFFRPNQIKQILEAGWDPVTYRQNTELFVQAWHWNPKGTWSDSSGQGYFVGDANPSNELIRHSYGYSCRIAELRGIMGRNSMAIPELMMAISQHLLEEQSVSHQGIHRRR